VGPSQLSLAPAGRRLAGVLRGAACARPEPRHLPAGRRAHKAPQPAADGAAAPGTPRRLLGQQLPAGSASERGAQPPHGEYVAVARTSAPMVCPSPGRCRHSPARWWLRPGLGMRQDLARELELCAGLRFPSPSAGAGMDALLTAGGRARPRRSLGPSAMLLPRNDRPGCRGAPGAQAEVAGGPRSPQR